MRENRTSGSEGGGTEQSVLPTPILKRGFFSCFQRFLSRTDVMIVLSVGQGQASSDDYPFSDDASRAHGASPDPESSDDSASSASELEKEMLVRLVVVHLVHVIEHRAQERRGREVAEAAA